MADGDDYRRYSTLRDASGMLLVVGTIGLVVLGGALGPVGFLIDVVVFLVPGGLLAGKAKRIRPR